jgi:TPR repeat protein
MYLKGLGTTQDPEEATKWFRKAAKAKHKGARKALKALEDG